MPKAPMSPRIGALRKKFATPASTEGSVVGSEDSWFDLGMSAAEDDWSSLGGTPSNLRPGAGVPASDGGFSELDLQCELVRVLTTRASAPSTLPRTPVIP